MCVWRAHSLGLSGSGIDKRKQQGQPLSAIQDRAFNTKSLLNAYAGDAHSVSRRRGCSVMSQGVPHRQGCSCDTWWLALASARVRHSFTQVTIGSWMWTMIPLRTRRAW